MNFWEQLAVNIFQAILSQLHFDPEKHKTLRNVLVPIRDTLLVLYPLQITQTLPPAPPA